MANNLQETAKDEVKELYLNSTNVFSSELLEYENGKRFNNPWHIQIGYALVDGYLTQEPSYTDKDGKVHIGKIIFNREQKVNRLVAMAWPRNHAKSTAISVHYPLRRLYKDNNLRILIGSNTSSQASSFLREGKSHLDRGDILVDKLGRLKPDMPEKWADNAIIINRHTKKKDPSISTVGTGGATLSKRCDIGILDDLLNPENVKTEEARTKTKFWVDNVFRPTIEPNTGEFIIIGTLWYEGDYLDECLQNPTFDVRLTLRCYIKDSKLGVGSEHEEALDIREVFSDEVIEVYGIDASSGVLWPERFPDLELQKIKASIGSVSFNRQYMNIIISDETSIIKSAWIDKCKDKSRILLPRYIVSESNLGIISTAVGVDLAVSEETIADWTSITALAQTKENKYVPLGHKRGHWSPAETRSQIKGFDENFRPQIIMVENNAFQNSLVKDMKATTTAPIKGFTTTGEKFDEYIGINSMAVCLENEQFVLPCSPEDLETITWFNNIRDQMLKFPSGHTGDDLMSLWFAFVGLRSLIGSEVASVKVRTGSSIYRPVMPRG
jgi:hypothetical protein